MPGRGDLASQRKARGRVKRLGQGIDELLDGDEVILLATVEVLQEDTREGVRVLIAS